MSTTECPELMLGDFICYNYNNNYYYKVSSINDFKAIKKNNNQITKIIRPTDSKWITDSSIKFDSYPVLWEKKQKTLSIGCAKFTRNDKGEIYHEDKIMWTNVAQVKSIINVSISIELGTLKPKDWETDEGYVVSHSELMEFLS